MFSFFNDKKTWNNWHRAGRSNLPDIITFLTPLEHSCISITTRLLKNGKLSADLLNHQEIYLEKVDKKIVSLLMLSSDSIITPVFTDDSSFDIPKDILKQSALYRKKYLTLMGLKDDIKKLEKLFDNRNRMSVDYFQLTASSADVPGRIDNYQQKSPFANYPLMIRRAEISDLEYLMPLRKAYEKEEVLIDPAHYNEQASMSRFKKTIIDKNVFYASSGETPVATCCISSAGVGWYQIGGVYTRPELRSRGISTRIMSELARTSEKAGKNLTLFVKKNNAPALKLYQNCGFSRSGDFRITYAERR